jgi:hypothetical protein
MRTFKFIFLVLLLVPLQLHAQSSAPAGGAFNHTAEQGGGLSCTNQSNYSAIKGDETRCANLAGNSPFYVQYGSYAGMSDSGEIWNATCHYQCTQASSESSAASSDSGCQPPNVKNILTGACEPKPSCTYPELYNSNDNLCHANPNNCPPNTTPIPDAGGSGTQSCYPGAGDHSCPAGFHFDAGFCPPDDPASSAAAGNSSTGANTSTPSSSGNASTGSNASQNSGNSGSNSSTGSGTQSPNTAIENCELTFGVGNCVITHAPATCPNSYKVSTVTFCITGGNSGSGSSSGNSGGAGGSSGSAASQGECDPTSKSYDECMGRNKTPDATQTAKIKSDFETSTNKLLDDYQKARLDDINDFSRDGISFKEAPNSLKSAIAAHFPTPSACQSLTLNFMGHAYQLNCEYFEKFKVIFAWALSFFTIIYCWYLAIKPVEQ